MDAIAPGKERPSTPDAGGWTAERVEARLVAEFRAFPYTGIRSPRPGVLETVSAFGDPAIKPTLIGLSALYLADPRRPHLRARTLSVARARAGVGNSIAQTCRDFGWDRSATYDDARLGYGRLADALNTAGIPLLPAA